MSETKYYYRIYGLSVKSDLEFPEAYSIEEQSECDVNIEMQDSTEIQELDTPVCLLVYGKHKSKLCFDVKGQITILNGQDIVYNQHASMNKKLTREMILGDGFGQMLYQKSIYCIHGSAMFFDGKAIAITGKSGAGKSTLAVALRHEGAEFMADDTVAVRCIDQTVYCYPGYPQQKMCENAAAELGYDLSELNPISEERSKYAIRLRDEYHSVKERLDALIIVEPYDGDCVTISEIGGGDKLSRLINSSYVFKVYQKHGISADEMAQCIQIAREVRVFSLNRPRTGNTTKEQISCIKNRLYTK